MEAGTSVNGGQSVLNPWYIIGGVASAVCSKEEFVMYVLLVPLFEEVNVQGVCYDKLICY